MPIFSILLLEKGRLPQTGNVEGDDEAEAVSKAFQAQMHVFATSPGDEFTVESEWKRTPTRIGIKYASKTLGVSAWVWILGPSELDKRGQARRMIDSTEEAAERTEHRAECSRRRAAGLALYSAYGVRQEVREAGGIWDASAKAWLLPSEEVAVKLGARRADGKFGPYWTI